MGELTVQMPDDARADLTAARRLLEDEGTLARALRLPARLLASGTLSLGRLLPAPLREVAEAAASQALQTACAAAAWNVELGPQQRGSFVLAAALGGLGGAGGLPGALVELPVTTTLILRRIAQIAAEEGEDLSDDAARAECVSVFALGAGADDDGTDSSYYAARVGLARAIDSVTRSGVRVLLPAMFRPVAQRFAVAAQAKLAAQAIPVLGALSGAAINAAFIRHFERRARGHFTVRRLERAYGADTVRAAYAQA